jgi:hypothetical protein
MKMLRLAGLLFVAVVAMGIVGVSSAAAELGNPLFTSKTGSFGQKLKAEGGESVLVANGLEAACEKNVATGEVSNALLIGNILIHYLGCRWRKGENGNNGCLANSTEQTGGLLLTNTLHAILGLILPSRQTGLLFLPSSGKTFVTFLKSEAPTEGTGTSCSVETAVTGNVAGAIEPALSFQTTFKILIGLSVGLPTSKDFDLTHGLGLVVPKLVAFGATGGLQQTESAELSAAIEIT